MNVNFNGVQSTTHSVTLIDAAGRRLSFSDSDGVAVGFSDGSGMHVDAGRGCGSARFVGSTSDPASLEVLVDADCRGSGIATQAKAEIRGCGTFRPDLLPRGKMRAGPARNAIKAWSQAHSPSLCSARPNRRRPDSCRLRHPKPWSRRALAPSSKPTPVSSAESFGARACPAPPSTMQLNKSFSWR
jgi:hypothetical protein